jgi:hypothetical protein
VSGAHLLDAKSHRSSYRTNRPFLECESIMFSLAAQAFVESRALELPPENGELVEMLARWRAAQGDDPLPPRASVTFEAMLPMVGRINLIDVLPARAADAEFHFAVRLMCTAREMHGLPGGASVRDIRPPALARALDADFVRCVRLATPTLHEVELSEGRRTVRFRRLLLPYAETPGAASPVLLAACLVDGPGVRAMMADPLFRDAD